MATSLTRLPAPRPAVLQSTWRALWDWPTTSQQRARRNAMIACNVLAEHRAQIRDVEDYLVRFAAPAARRTTQA